MRSGASSPELLRDLTETRLAFEPIAARGAAARVAVAADAIVAVDRALERMWAAAEGRDDPHGSDVAFHAAILRASGNRFFAALVPLIETALLHSIRATNAAQGDPVGDLAAHARVRDEIAGGDADGAEAAMRALLGDVRRTLGHDANVWSNAGTQRQRPPTP
jgi:DNA-binding FadR family transcriptional regulator